MARAARGAGRLVCAALAVAGALLPTGLTAQTSCAAHRDARMTAALQSGYGVQYWGPDYTASDLARQPHGLLILELTRWSEGPEDRFSTEEIAQIRRGGTRPVLAYLNVTEVEPFRDYYAAAADEDRPAWWGLERETDHLAAYWTPEWRALLEDRIDALMAQGVDGIFLDDALHYYTWLADGPAPDARPYAADLMRLVTALADRARRTSCAAMVVVNNAVFVGRDAGPESAAAFDRYRAAIDGILVESALGPQGAEGTLAALTEDYAHHAIAVLTLDVVRAEDRSGVLDAARRLGFAPYTVSEDSFSRLYPPAPAP